MSVEPCLPRIQLPLVHLEIISVTRSLWAEFSVELENCPLLVLSILSSFRRERCSQSMEDNVRSTKNGEYFFFFKIIVRFENYTFSLWLLLWSLLRGCDIPYIKFYAIHEIYNAWNKYFKFSYDIFINNIKYFTIKN